MVPQCLERLESCCRGEIPVDYREWRQGDNDVFRHLVDMRLVVALVVLRWNCGPRHAPFQNISS